MLVVLEHDEVVGGDAAVAGEDEADIDGPALEGGVGERPARVQRLEVLEMQTVHRYQALLAERALRALGRSAQSPSTGDRGHIRELDQVIRIGLGLADGEGILINRRRWIERLDALRTQHRIEFLDVRLRIGSCVCRDSLPLLDKGQVGGCVAGVQVDLAVLEGWLHDFAVAELIAVGDGVPLVLEGATVDVRQDDALREVEGRDCDLALRARRAGRPTRRATRGRDQCQGNHAGAQDEDSLQIHCSTSKKMTETTPPPSPCRVLYLTVPPSGRFSTDGARPAWPDAGRRRARIRRSTKG